MQLRCCGRLWGGRRDRGGGWQSLCCRQSLQGSGSEAGHLKFSSCSATCTCVALSVSCLRPVQQCRGRGQPDSRVGRVGGCTHTVQAENLQGRRRYQEVSGRVSGGMWLRGLCRAHHLGQQWCCWGRRKMCWWSATQGPGPGSPPTSKYGCAASSGGREEAIGIPRHPCVSASPPIMICTPTY